MYNIFHATLLEKGIIKKRKVNKLLKLELKLDTGENQGYNVKVIKRSAVYINETARGQLPRLYYLLSWKGYSKDESS